jgi:hypothetical protein
LTWVSRPLAARKLDGQALFRKHYQKQIDSVSKRVMGIEALIRWNHPKHGFLGPDQFISIDDFGTGYSSLSYIHKLPIHARPAMLERLPLSTARWRAGEIGDAAYAGLYFLHWQTESHGKRFASRRSKHDPRPTEAGWREETQALAGRDLDAWLASYFARTQFFGVIVNVPDALSAWLRGAWPLRLHERIPSSREVLAMQVQGERPVTVLSAWPRMTLPVLGKPNAFAFMVHDLEHAWKFYADAKMHRAQRAFFAALRQALAQGAFAAYLGDEVFAGKFDYLVSDMNTHVMHATQFLRAILLERHLRLEGASGHAELSLAAHEKVGALLAELFGAEWVEEVEARMVPSALIASSETGKADLISKIGLTQSPVRAELVEACPELAEEHERGFADAVHPSTLLRANGIGRGFA